ncbi:MAG: lytic transglycosylase domain-containing protein [Candidatus Aminicenantes bacterium]|nr:MAG: lytic transglycosylase domain-containing protein [Candidatus Aminicenantes bacterium]
MSTDSFHSVKPTPRIPQAWPGQPGQHPHHHKISGKVDKLLHYIFFIELILIFSIISSYLILTLVKSQTTSAGSMSTTSPSNYRHLFRNYRILNSFVNLPIRTDPIQDAEFEIDNPFIIDILTLKDAVTDLEENREKNASRIGDIILHLEEKHKPHPHRYSYILHKKNAPYLKYLYFVKNYDELIAQYDRDPYSFDTLGLKLFLINSYVKTRDNEKAFEMFKDLFAENRLGSFENYLSRQTLNSFLRRLDYDYWFRKFKYLAKTNQYSEFLREKNYIRSSPLHNLFYAEFNYKQKQYDQCRRNLARVKDERLLTYKERIIFKLNLREENTDNLPEKLALLQKDPEIYLEVLGDAASILLIQGELRLALNFYLRYITYTEIFQYIHLIRSGYIPPLGENYWKSLWISAWIHYNKNNKAQAAFYFKQGIDSPILSYRIANRYWLQRVDKNTSTIVNLENYPFTYYYTRGKSLNHSYQQERESLQPFINLLNHGNSSRFAAIIKDLKGLVHYNLIDEAVDFIRWAAAEEGLSTSDKHTLMLVESILHLRQGNDAMAFISFRDNFQCYQCVRLPRFLSRIALPVKYTDLIDQYSQMYKLDRTLIFAIIREESFFRPEAVSPANAYGLMQLLLETARQVAYPHRIKVFRRDLFDPEKNIRFGTEYLKQLLEKYKGKLHLALAAYNAGWERVDQWLDSFGTVKDDEFIEMIPFTATRNYVKNILRSYYYYRLYYGEGSE